MIRACWPVEAKPPPITRDPPGHFAIAFEVTPLATWKTAFTRFTLPAAVALATASCCSPAVASDAAIAPSVAATIDVRVGRGRHLGTVILTSVRLPSSTGRG